MIPKNIKILNNELPDSPGVYFYYDEIGDVIYVGKATSLKRRVNSYFNKAQDDRITELVSKIARIAYIKTPTVIEALVLEANKIKAHKPYYNILQRDDKSFLYLVITNEDYPKPLLMRGLELDRLGINPFDKNLSAKAKTKFIRVFGPYTSGPSLKKALEYVRKFIPWSVCEPPAVSGRTKPCFDRQIKKCPGVCTGEIGKQEYRKIINRLILFFEGKKGQLMRHLKKDMKIASRGKKFEEAAKLRNNIFALEHIQDVAFITKEDVTLPITRLQGEDIIDLDGRIEAYDISNISGTSAVGSMVVFEDGQPAKDKYRKFKIKTVEGANDVAMLEEMMRRRLVRAEKFQKAWPLPEVMIIDGGKGQVNRVQRILDELQIKVPIIGIAKGFDRKQDRLVFDRQDLELARVAARGKELFQKVRDEAHRFAVSYHRQVRSKASGVKRRHP
ncbi:MAG: excinuclease ABC subunit UvrC [Patescibacteria group bacterium]